MHIQQPEQHNDVHFTGQLFARIPHAFLKDVKDPIAIAVYNHLMVYADWNSGLAHPKRETLARALGYKTTRAVDNAIKHLVEKGWVKTFPRWIKTDPETDKKTLVYEYGERCKQTSNGYIVYDQKQQNDVEKRGVHSATRGGDSSTPQGSTTVHTNKNQLNKNQLTNKDMLISGETSENQTLTENYSIPGLETTKGQQPTNGDEQTASSQKKTPAQKYPQEFLDWYAIYPRKKAKGDALKAYRQAVKEIAHDELMERTRKFARYVEQSETESKFVPYPATWLRAAQWEDEPDTETQNNTGRSTPGASKPTALEIAHKMIFQDGYGQNSAEYENNPHTKELNW